jgi:hypothetical protein
MVTRALALAAGAALFAVLATANSGGYRYGISDQAFYVPAVVRAADPDAFPRDRPLIDAQATLMLTDELLAAAATITRADLATVHLGLYLATMAALFAAAVLLARALQGSWWMAAVLALLMTFRHRIAKTGANSLEGYAHPRMLAFAFGAMAVACALRARWGWSALLVAIAAALHTTTALWFALLLVAAAAAARREWRPWIGGAAGIAAGAAGAAALWGPLAARLVRMDDAWLQVLQDKDYLFPTGWPLYAWVLNLLYFAIVLAIHRRRRAHGVQAPGETAIVWGLAALLAVFAISVPLTAWRLALAVQLQVTRVFWLLDLVAMAFLAWWLTDAARRRQPAIRMAAVAALLLCSASRGVYLLTVAQPERSLVQARLEPTPWVNAMRWLRAQPKDWHVLADPGHAWKYGVAVRIAAERDTVLEWGKDTAVAMYDRGVAIRVAARAGALGEFDRLTADTARALADRFDVDVVVVARPHTIALPVLYENDQFMIYDVR